MSLRDIFDTSMVMTEDDAAWDKLLTDPANLAVLQQLVQDIQAQFARGDFGPVEQWETPSTDGADTPIPVIARRT